MWIILCVILYMVHNQAFFAARSEWLSLQIFNHYCYIGRILVVIFTETSSCSLNILYVVNITSIIRIPHYWCTFHFWSHKFLVQGTFSFLFTKPNVSFDQNEMLHSQQIHEQEVFTKLVSFYLQPNRIVCDTKYHKSCIAILFDLLYFFLEMPHG